MNRVKELIQEHLDVIQNIFDNDIEKIIKISDLVNECLSKGFKLIFIGNGGSASDAQHLSAEFVGRFQKERNPLPAISLSTDTSAITAIGNDYGFDRIFERQINALASPGDILFAISTSGNSPNIIEGIKAATNKGCVVIGLLGKTGGEAKNLCDECIIIDHHATARIQEGHIMVGHIICSLNDVEFKK